MINQEALKQVITGTSQQRKYLCGQEFSLFFSYYYLEYIKYAFAEFHYEMFGDIRGLMAGTYREIAWIMFRESAKTSIAKAFITWLICYKKRAYINVDSFDKENAERILFDVVLFLQTNEKFIADFGELFNSKRNPDEIQQKRVNNFVTNNGIRVEAHSTQESVRGRLHAHQRPDALVLDDFETNKTKDSVAYTQQVISHINEFKAGLDSTALIVYLGNYITEFGSVQTLIERAKVDNRLKVRIVPVIGSDGLPTWPAKYALTDQEAVETGKVSLADKKKQLGSQVFNAEMMNQPIDEETQEFHKHNFRYRPMQDVMARKVRKFATIDSALTRLAKSDYTGITKNYVDEKGDWNLIAKRYKINSRELINLIFQMHDEGFEKIGIEEGAFTQAVQPFYDEECRTRSKYPYLVMLKHGGIMKETRIRGLIPRYEAGTIWHITGQCDDLEDELLRFPKSAHDDTMDSTAYQNQIAEAPYPQEEAEQESEPIFSDIGI